MFINLIARSPIISRDYGPGFKWTGNHTDLTPRDKWGRRQTTVVAMDAIKFEVRSRQYKAG